MWDQWIALPILPIHGILTFYCYSENDRRYPGTVYNCPYRLQTGKKYHHKHLSEGVHVYPAILRLVEGVVVVFGSVFSLLPTNNF